MKSGYNTYTIGSTALKELFPDFGREPKDMDLLIHSEDTRRDHAFTTRIEFLQCPPLYTYLEANGLTADVLLTLKCSHIFWNINWDKHMHDICFLFGKGCKVIRPLFDELYQHWNEWHGNNKRSQLAMTAEDFFNNAVSCPHDHDWLHTLINPSPTYLKVLKDGAEVDVSEDKFNALSFEEKCDLVREEVYVMAYERMGSRSYKAAYYWMLKKFIMSHAPMWEALFILENFRHLDRPLINYKNQIENGIREIHGVLSTAG